MTLPRKLDYKRPGLLAKEPFMRTLNSSGFTLLRNLRVIPRCTESPWPTYVSVNWSLNWFQILSELWLKAKLLDTLLVLMWDHAMTKCISNAIHLEIFGKLISAKHNMPLSKINCWLTKVRRGGRKSKQLISECSVCGAPPLFTFVVRARPEPSHIY